MKIRLIDLWYEHRTLIIYLTFPLVIASIIALLIARPFSTSDILVNLASDFLIVIITIWYVDWVIRRNEERKWVETVETMSCVERYIPI